jgi:hypothetical protein
LFGLANRLVWELRIVGIDGRDVLSFLGIKEEIIPVAIDIGS